MSQSFFLITLLISITTTVFAQPPTLKWVNHFNNVGYGALGRPQVDALGNVYQTGSFKGVHDFDPGTNSTVFNSQGNHNAFIQKLDSAGNFIWAIAFEGVFPPEPPGPYSVACSSTLTSIAFDHANNLILSGRFSGTVCFGGTNYTATTSWSGNPSFSDIFWVKVSPNGQVLSVETEGASEADYIQSLAIDPQQNILFTSYEESTTQTNSSSSPFFVQGNFFLTKKNSNGVTLWKKKLASHSYVNILEVKKVVLDANSNIYITGRFSGTIDFDPGPATRQLVATGNRDLFILKLNPAGNFEWVKQTGGQGTASESVEDFIIDGSGNFFLSGYFSGTSDFDMGAGAHQVNSSSTTSNDLFLLKMNPAGNFEWVKTWATNSKSQFAYLAANSWGDIYCSGRLSSVIDMNPETGIDSIGFVATNTLFLIKIDNNGHYDWGANLATSNDQPTPPPLLIDDKDNLFINGSFLDTISIDPDSANYSIISHGDRDGFLLKYSTNRPIFPAVSKTIVSTDLDIFPNPVRSHLNVLLPENINTALIQIFDTKGRLIQTVDKRVDADNLVQITQLEQLASGIYWVRIESDKHLIFLQKFVKN